MKACDLDTEVHKLARMAWHRQFFCTHMFTHLCINSTEQTSYCKFSTVWWFFILKSFIKSLHFIQVIFLSNIMHRIKWRAAMCGVKNHYWLIKAQKSTKSVNNFELRLHNRLLNNVLQLRSQCVGAKHLLWSSLHAGKTSAGLQMKRNQHVFCFLMSWPECV